MHIYMYIKTLVRYQGYMNSSNQSILFQDNESAIRILLSGQDNSSGGIKHIKSREYWFKDYVDSIERKKS